MDKIGYDLQIDDIAWQFRLQLSEVHGLHGGAELLHGYFAGEVVYDIRENERFSNLAF